MIDEVSFVVLAAGRGKRFGGPSRPKVLHELCGRPCLEYVLDLTNRSEVLVVTSPEIQSKLGPNLKCVIQQQPLGTGDALMLALEHLPQDKHICVLLGDMPLLKQATVNRAISQIDKYDLVFGMFRCSYPNRYGRVLQQGNQYKVLEYKEYPDLSEFYNAGWLCINRSFVNKMLHARTENESSEHYLTKYIGLTHNCLGIEVDSNECIGVNDLDDYRNASVTMNRRLLNRAFMNGVNFLAPDSVHIRWDTKLEPGCTVHQNVVFGPSVSVGSDSQILPFTYISDSTIGSHCTIGPFAHLRNNTVLKDSVHIGSYCEVKSSTIGKGSKSKHQSYIGDAELGEHINVGAGTVFLNYDGARKHKSVVGNQCFLGGNSAYVAPIELGDEVYIGAGTVVRENVDSGHLVVSRPKDIKRKRLKIEPSID